MSFWSAAIPVATSLLGAVSGSKNKVSTQQSTPILYEGEDGQKLLGDTRSGFQKLLDMATDLSSQPYEPLLKTRYQAEGAFANPQMAAVQRDSDINRLLAIAGGVGQEEAPQEDNSAQADAGRALARQMLKATQTDPRMAWGIPGAAPGRDWRDALMTATDAGYAKLGEMAGGMSPVTQGVYQGGFASPTGKAVSMSDLLKAMAG